MSAFADLEALAVMEVWGRDVIARRIDGERITLAVVELAPGASIPSHQHPHEQVGICVSGELRFRVGDEERDLRPGGTWRVPPGIPHEVVAGPDGAVAIDVFTPTRDDWDFPLLPAVPPAWPPPDG